VNTMYVTFSDHLQKMETIISHSKWPIKNILTPRFRVFLDKFIVIPLIKEFTTFMKQS
jgi:hypothetical protein